MAVLTFSMPFATFAQQTVVAAQAESDAIADADKDVNKPLWFGAGCLLSGLVFVPLPGIYTSCLLPPIGITGAYFYQPDPSPARFIGKSPEYVSVYTSAYKSKRGKTQASMSSAGCLTGCGAIGLTLVGIGFALLDDFELPAE
ncbi:hypothetical protein C6501_15720 [Candidatus Poribacteria bacterium]|nr:MAG: hypothetical protein C6501_15720 [Candidatus Poribacteria bacterium]